MAAGMNTLFHQISPHPFFSPSFLWEEDVERRALICLGKKYHNLLVRTDEIETASGTPLSVWCLGRLCPQVKCAVEEEKHNEIIGLEKSTGLQRPHVSLWGMGKEITFFFPSQHTSLLSFSIKAILNKVEENFLLSPWIANRF